jgi:hypothetical protein
VRALTNIGKEIGKTVAPSLTDTDAASAIVFILLSFWVVASRKHRGPDVIDRMVFCPAETGVTVTIVSTVLTATT